jgi:hypothetical protein
MTAGRVMYISKRDFDKHRITAYTLDLLIDFFKGVYGIASVFFIGAFNSATPADRHYHASRFRKPILFASLLC